MQNINNIRPFVCSSIQERIAMSSLQGLPPLPRSLSGFNLSGGRGESGEPPPPPTRSSSKSQRGGKTSSSRPSPPARQLTTLDTQLAVLRREMVLVRESFSLSCFSANIAECSLVTLIDRTHPSMFPRNSYFTNRSCCANNRLVESGF